MLEYDKLRLTCILTRPLDYRAAIHDGRLNQKDSKQVSVCLSLAGYAILRNEITYFLIISRDSIRF